MIGTFLKAYARHRAVFAGSVFWVFFFGGECCSICVVVCGKSGIRHGGRRLCTVFSVLRQLSHRKAPLALPLRAGSQQLSVKYGDLYGTKSVVTKTRNDLK